MSDLLSKLQVLKPAPQEAGCPVARLYKELDAETATLLKIQIEQSTVPLRRIHGALQASGVKIGRDTIGNHRSGDCICQKEA
jgi:hypothetical protein